MKRIIYRTPTELLERASQRMIPLECQKQAQQQIATLISMHLDRIHALNEGAEACELVGNSAFLVAPTGCGKSYIVRSLAEVSGLSFAVVDCTSITQTGTRGKNLSHCLRGILEADKTFFEGGIIIFDEMDKKFFTGYGYYDAFSPMQDFLKLLEGGNYTFKCGDDCETVNLDKTLFLFAGACAKIVGELKRKYAPSTVGFVTENNEQKVDISDYGSLVTLEDLCEYGMMPELCSRINTVIHIPKLDTEAYKHLTNGKEKTAALNKFRNQFAMRGVQLDMTPEAVDKLAGLCVERDVGARSVQAILNEQLSAAYGMVENDRSCGKVVLQTNADGDLQVKYLAAKRIPAPKFMFGDKNDRHLHIDITKELKSEEEINRFCNELCQCAQLQDYKEELLFYYFLQTACRYLANFFMPTEYNTRSLFKLVPTTRGGRGSYTSNTAFDIMCKDWMDELQKPAKDESEAVLNRLNFIEFQHFYFAFKSEESQNAHTAATLNEALSSAVSRYILQNQSKKTSTEATG